MLISRKRYKIETYFQWKTNRKSYMAYRMAPVLVTWNDLEGHSPVAGHFKCNPSNICAVFYQISTDSALTWSLSDTWASCLHQWSCMEEGLSQKVVVGLELTMESIMTGAHSKRWRERVTNFRSCNTETAGTKWSANEWSGKQICVWEPERTSRMMTMQEWP